MTQLHTGTAPDNLLLSEASRLAEEMWVTLNRGGHASDADPWTLMEQAVGLISDLQRQLGAQRDRIAYFESLATRDSLTGLLNRRGLDEQLRRILAEARRHDERGVVIFVDLDGFRAVNHTMGHHAGDAMLRHLADLLTANVRESDIVARIGGDEFVVALVKTAPEEAESRSLRLQMLANNSKFGFAGARIPLCASFGYAPYRSGDNPLEVFTRADAAMYRNKCSRRQSVAPTGRIARAAS
jgi:diguanylate cyclase (GGDEF)-like protein